MYTIEPNAALEAALDAAFNRAQQGKSFLVFEEGPCKVVLKNGAHTDVIELTYGDAEVHFFHNDHSNHGAGGATSNASRSRNWYIISFGNGSLLVNARQRTTQVTYRPSTRFGSQRVRDGIKT